MEDIVKKLKDIVGKEFVLYKREDLIPYQRDASYIEGNLPIAVVIPSTTEQVSKIMKLCYEREIPAVVRGGGSSLTGSSVLATEGIIISMLRFDRILEISIEDRYVIAEAGVRLDRLNSELAKYKHFYPPDPASSITATVGGSISTNAGGLRASMYGSTKEWVLGLEVVLPNGEIINTGGKVLKRSIGYDLTALMIGAEGTLGIITKAILKIAPIPESIGRIMIFYDSVEEIGEAVIALRKIGIVPLIAEFMDRVSMDAIKKTRGMDFPENAKYMLLIDIASTKESLNRLMDEAEEAIKANTEVIYLRKTTDKEEMEKMYLARKGLYSSLLEERQKRSETVIMGDFVVPTSRLPLTLKGIKEIAEELDLKVALFGHVGDGNIHTNVYVDMKDEKSILKFNEFNSKVSELVIKNGGSISAEHGIGIAKIDLLFEELKARNNLKNIELMKAIKKVFDPKDILNRGKLFR